MIQHLKSYLSKKMLLNTYTSIVDYNFAILTHLHFHFNSLSKLGTLGFKSAQEQICFMQLFSEKFSYCKECLYFELVRRHTFNSPNEVRMVSSDAETFSDELNEVLEIYENLEEIPANSSLPLAGKDIILKASFTNFLFLIVQGM